MFTPTIVLLVKTSPQLQLLAARGKCDITYLYESQLCISMKAQCNIVIMCLTFMLMNACILESWRLKRKRTRWIFPSFTARWRTVLLLLISWKRQSDTSQQSETEVTSKQVWHEWGFLLLRQSQNETALYGTMTKSIVCLSVRKEHLGNISFLSLYDRNHYCNLEMSVSAICVINLGTVRY